MKIKLFKILLSIVTIFFSSCNFKSENENITLNNKEYFDIEEFILYQVNLLDSINAKLSKTVWLNNKKETKMHEKVDWKKEFELFKELNINKPSLKIKFIKIVLTDNNMVNSIEGRLYNENVLYKTEKQLKLTCRSTYIQDKRSGEYQIIIDSYEISGFQKNIFMDSFYYKISSEIIF